MRYKALLFFLLILLTSGGARIYGQSTIYVKGTVTDATTKEPLPFASITLLPESLYTHVYSDENGRYLIELDPTTAESIQFSSVGYTAVVLKVPKKSSAFNISLNTEMLDAANITAKRIRYRNKNNPAVDLIRKAIDRKDKNRIESQESYTYKRYEKLQLAFNNLNDSIANSRLFRQFPFFTKYIDTADGTGVLSFPVYIRENMYQHYYRKHPKAEKKVHLATQMANFNDFIEQDAINVILDGIIGKSNIYDNNITILENEYISPLSPLAPSFYRFHIIDTLYVNGISCINLHIFPRNEGDFGFSGNIFITNDSLYAVKRAELSFPKNAGVNFVKDFTLVQEFTMVDSTWCLTTDEAVIDFSLTGKNSAVLGKVSNIYSNYQLNILLPDNELPASRMLETSPDVNARTPQYWDENRPVALNTSEQGVYDMVNDMKQDRKFSKVLNVGGIIFSSYLSLGGFDLGPVSTLVSHNDIEGFRFRVGGKTNARFNPNLFFDGFAAYGTKDERFKYKAEASYSFNKKKLYQWEFPMNLLTISYEDNIETPGQFFQYGNADRFFMSFYRGTAKQMVYHKTFNVTYTKEFENGFSIKPSFTHKEESPTGSLVYANSLGNITKLTSSLAGLTLRYAPNERYYQIQQNRYQLNHTNPIISLSYTYGMDDFWNSDYEFHRLDFSIDKRCWFSTFGFADISVKAGKVWNNVPFPFLIIHRANQSYEFQHSAYNMMNYMEFVSDVYAATDISYSPNGLIFNRIPLIKKLKWREFFTFKALWGRLSDGNTPANNPELFYFPINNKGEQTMYSLNSEPYMEAGFAIDNIFKFLRLDFVRRISYLNHPDVSKWGVRFSLRFVF